MRFRRDDTEYDCVRTDNEPAPNALSNLKAKFKSLLKGGKKDKKEPAEAKPAEPTPAITDAPTETSTATEAAPAPAGKSPT